MLQSGRRVFDGALVLTVAIAWVAYDYLVPRPCESLGSWQGIHKREGAHPSGIGQVPPTTISRSLYAKVAFGSRYGLSRGCALGGPGQFESGSIRRLSVLSFRKFRWGRRQC